jgi:hypothetical protein
MAMMNAAEISNDFILSYSLSKYCVNVTLYVLATLYVSQDVPTVLLSGDTSTMLLSRRIAPAQMITTMYDWNSGSLTVQG